MLFSRRPDARRRVHGDRSRHGPVTNVGQLDLRRRHRRARRLIRVWGGLPEGVMYAILLMNALMPFINQATQPRVFGTRLAKAQEAAT